MGFWHIPNSPDKIPYGIVTIHDDVINGNIFRVTGPLWGESTDTRWRGALMFSLICAWTRGWTNNRDAGDLRRHRTHYDVTIMHPDCTISSNWGQNIFSIKVMMSHWTVKRGMYTLHCLRRHNRCQEIERRLRWKFHYWFILWSAPVPYKISAFVTRFIYDFCVYFEIQNYGIKCFYPDRTFT